MTETTNKSTNESTNKLNKLLISGLTLDSRFVQAGDLFIALSGTKNEGSAYIESAIKKGAVAVLVEAEAAKKTTSTLTLNNLSVSVPVLEYSNLRNCLSHIADRFYDQPSLGMRITGVTGTNGKTSITQLIAQLFGFFHHSCGVMGTLGNGFLDSLTASPYTTQDAIATQQTLAELKARNAQTVAMEVSSHALRQGRVEGVRFQNAIFTNLTRDHLDYHADMEDYFQAKVRLFIDLNPCYSIINVDDAYGRRLVEYLMDRFPEKVLAERIIGYSLNSVAVPARIKDSLLMVSASEILFEEHGIRATIDSPWGKGVLQCGLLGPFNLSNILAALTTVCLEGLPLEEVLQKIASLKTVKGRMMPLPKYTQDPLVIIDFAHTPDALQQALAALRLHCKGRLWCVFGCGGDRDRGKRAEMAEVTETLSDEIIVTQDNPRFENPDQIIQDILKGFSDSLKIKQASRLQIEQNRRKAIQLAIASAGSNDIVLIAGKGHENYQIIGEEKQVFDDEHEAMTALTLRRNKNEDKTSSRGKENV